MTIKIKTKDFKVKIVKDMVKTNLTKDKVNWFFDNLTHNIYSDIGVHDLDRAKKRVKKYFKGL